MLNIQFLPTFKTNRNVQASNVNFTGKPDRLVKQLCATDEKTVRKICVRYEDAVSLYKKMGCDILFKSGSHSVVKTPDGENLQLVIPHKGENKISRHQVIDLINCVYKFYPF